MDLASVCVPSLPSSSRTWVRTSTRGAESLEPNAGRDRQIPHGHGVTLATGNDTDPGEVTRASHQITPSETLPNGVSTPHMIG